MAQYDAMKVAIETRSGRVLPRPAAPVTVLRLSRRSRRARWVTFGVAWCILLAGCGSENENVKTREPRSLKRVRVEDSAELRAALGGTALHTLVVPTRTGIAVLGGIQVNSDGAIESALSEMTIVHDDGTASVLTGPTSGPIANVSGTSVGNKLYVAGTACREGRVGTDDGSIRCEPGEAVLAALDLETSTWTEIDPPPGAGRPAGFLDDQKLHALDEQNIVYTTADSSGDGSTNGWSSADGGETWRPMESVPGWMCASEGELLAGDLPDSTEAELNGEGGGPSDALEELDLRISRYDAGTDTWSRIDEEPPSVHAIAGGTSLACSNAAGVLAFTITGGRSGAIVAYSSVRGWSVVKDEEGARFLDLLPSTDGVLLPQIGTQDLIWFDDEIAEGAHRTINVPNDSVPIAGLGEAVLLLENGHPVVHR